MQLNPLNVATSVAVGALLLAAQASAQNKIDMYGIADAGIEVTNNAVAGGGSLMRLNTGNLSGSRFGLRGTEDMGGGLKAVFALESGIAYDTGAFIQEKRAFNRQASVGLQGSWGTFSMGRQTSLMLDWISKFNTMDNGRWSAKVHAPAFSDRMDNSIKYIGKFGSFDAGAYYSAGYDSTKGGEVAGHSKAGRQMGGGVQYKGDGFRTALVYDQKNGLTAALENNTDKHLAWGARYKFGAAEVMGGYLQRKVAKVGAKDERTDMSWIGVIYQASDTLQLRASYYKTDVKDSNKDPSSIITAVKYALSKRTDLYLINSYVMNKNGSNLGVGGFGRDVIAGKNQFGTMAGIRHTF